MNTAGTETTSTATTTLFELADAPPAAPASADTTDTAPEQLTLLPSEVPLQFRLDERTRRAGLRHVAELRAQIAQQAANRADRNDRLLRRPAGRRMAA